MSKTASKINSSFASLPMYDMGSHSPAGGSHAQRKMVPSVSKKSMWLSPRDASKEKHLSLYMDELVMGGTTTTDESSDSGNETEEFIDPTWVVDENEQEERRLWHEKQRRILDKRRETRERERSQRMGKIDDKIKRPGSKRKQHNEQSTADEEDTIPSSSGSSPLGQSSKKVKKLLVKVPSFGSGEMKTKNLVEKKDNANNNKDKSAKSKEKDKDKDRKRSEKKGDGAPKVLITARTNRNRIAPAVTNGVIAKTIIPNRPVDRHLGDGI